MSFIKKQKSTILRLVFSLLAVFLVPILFLYVTYTFKIVRTVRTELENIVIANSKNAISQIDLKIENLNNAIEMFQRGNGYQSYLTRSFDNDNQGNSAINSMSSDIFYIYLLSEIADDFVVAISDYDTMFSASGMQTSENYLTKNFITTQYSVEQLKNLFFNTESKKTILIENLVTKRSSGEHLVFVYPLTKTIEGKGANAAFSVPMYRISSILAPQSESFDVQTFVVDESGKYLFCHNMSESNLNEVLSKGLDSKTIELDNNKYHIVKNTSSVTGWSYFTLIPKDNTLVNQTFKINKYFMIYILLVLLVGIALIVLLFKLNYKPIRNLKDKTIDILEAKDQNQDDLGTIETAITKLKNKADTSIDEIRYSRMQSLIYGLYPTIDDFNKDCEQINLFFSGPFFAVSIVLFSEKTIIDKVLISAVKEILSEEHECELAVDHKNHRIISVHSLKEEKNLEVSYFYPLMGTFNDSFGISPLIGIGRTHLGSDSIEKSFFQAKNALEFKATNPEKKVIHYNEVLNYFVSEQDFYPHNEMRIFANSVNSLDFQGIEKSLNELLSIAVSQKTTMLTSKWICFDVLKTLASNNHITQNSSFKISEMLTQLINEEKRSSIESMLTEVNKNIRAFFSTEPSDNTSIIDDMLEYINDNYCRYDFSVQEIADKFKIGLGTAGQLFKDNTNRGLLEYIIDLRMEKAKNLLSLTNKAVKEISYEVGYYNVTSFIRRFKDHENVTPNEYRFHKN